MDDVKCLFERKDNQVYQFQPILPYFAAAEGQLNGTACRVSDVFLLKLAHICDKLFIVSYFLPNW